MDVLDQWLVVQGLRIHYLSARETGSPVLLLHGGGTDSARLSWGQVIGPLAAGHHVYAPDLPGYGDSDRPDIRYSTEFYVSFVGNLMEALGLSRASLMGLSMGGAIALGTTLRWPERVDKLALVDSYGLQRTVAMHKLSYLMVHTPGIMEATWALMRSNRAMGRAGLRNVLHDASAAPESLVNEVYAEASKPHAGRAFTTYQRDEMLWNGLRTVYLDRLHETHVPTLLVHGREDRGVPLACAEEAHSLIAGSRLHVIDGAGHWSQRENPKEFNRVVTEFLKD
jgi:pimeloyl-ACP methyl ester carboxylesterase